MNKLHPHWQTTDEDERPVRVTDANAQHSRPAQPRRAAPSVPRAKRGPAAFIGIAVFLGIGFALFQGVNGLLGQVASPDDTVIRITDSGIDPSVVTVEPGKKIRWNNESTIPHIFESETLPTADDKPFATTAIFPNGFYEYIVPAGSSSGTHDYASRTSVEVKGQIIIDAGSAPASPAPTTTPPVIPPYTPPVQQIPDTIEYSDPSPADTGTSGQTASVGGIPQNPNTVGSGNAPLPPRQQPGAGNTQGSVMQHLPSANTATGMEIWVTLAIAGFSLAYVTRKAVRDC